MQSVNNDELSLSLKALKVLLNRASHEITVPLNACWIDHSSCPYGLPGGKFTERPSCCVYSSGCSVGGCSKLGMIITVIEKEVFGDQFISMASAQLSQDPDFRKRIRDDVVDQIQQSVDQITVQFSEVFDEYIKRLYPDSNMSDVENLILQAASIILSRISGIGAALIEKDKLNSIFDITI